jgi:YidC/Oxa1 family membrane protein insertase
VSLIEHALDGLHATTGLPWAGTIMLATVGVRVLLLPLVFRTMRNSARLHNIRPEMEVRGNGACGAGHAALTGGGSRAE